MPTLTEILQDPSRNGVYRLKTGVTSSAGGSDASSQPSAQPSVSLSDVAEAIRLDARICPDRDSILEAMGEALHFPDYYGMNWDALEECLFDLSWWAGPVIVLIEHAEALDRDALATLVDVWIEAAAAWAEAGRVCVLLLAGEDEVDTVPAIEV